MAAAARIPKVGVVTQSQVGGGWVLTRMALGGDGSLPVVHGFMGEGTVEGTVLSLDREGIVASRDLVGTRPLYMGRSGDCLATDRRLLPGEEDLTRVPPGSGYRLGGGGAWHTRPRLDARSDCFEEEAARLARELERSVKARVEGARTTAVAFSGGVDSALLALCAVSHTRVIACSAFAAGSRDEKAAAKAAEALGLEFLAVRVDATRLREESAAMSLPFAPSSMDRALWCIYSLASRAASEGGAELILLGQLADELFGGYMKYARVDEPVAREMMERDVFAAGDRGFIRDESACARWLEPSFPYADDRVVELGLSLPTSYKLKQGVRKAVLREAAVTLGLPEELAAGPKKAAQYSSGVLKLASALEPP